MQLFVLIAMASLVGSHALAQITTNATAASSTNQPAGLSIEAVEKAWSFSASAYTYIVPDSREYVQPTLTADRGWLHLEARYNYEALETGSAWIGYNFAGGEKLAWEFTPMLGGVFGDLNAVAPGYEATLSWWKLELYTEGEFVVSPGSHAENFFYTWSELSLAPVEWFRFGIVAQRTKAYETDFDIQRGFFAGFSFKRVDFTAYVFNPDDQPTVVLGLGFGF